MKLDWYTIRNQTDDVGAPAEVFIYDEIGGSMGVNALDFINELNEIESDEITVRINSPGGLLIDGIAIANALEQHPAHIRTRVDSIAASAASIIAMAGDTVEMMNGSQLMIHDVSCGAQGNAKDFRETAAWLEEQSNNVARMYARKAGGDIADWRARMLSETWMFADEAVEIGLADAIYTRDVAELEAPDPQIENEEEEPEDTEDETVVLENLMVRKHRLTNRGFKYLGRNRAPDPLSDDENLDKFIAAMQQTLRSN